jgi:hypothetical protein
MREKHTEGWLEVVDGRRIGITLPAETGDGFDSHCVAITHDSNGRLDAVASARRLVACWNACDGIETSLLEQFPRGMNGMSNIAIGKQRDELLAALEAEQEWRDREEAGAIDPEWNYERMVGDKRRAAIAKVKGGAA